MSTIKLEIPVSALRDLLRAADVALDDNHRQSFSQPDNGSAGPRFEQDRSMDPWTDKQKRFVFRLLQQLGHEGDAAGNFVRTSLRLADDEHPTRAQASSFIDRLKLEVGSNGKGVNRAAS